MAESCLIGLAATSGVPGTLGTAVIDQLTITPSLANLAPAITTSSAGTAYLDLPAALTNNLNDDGRPALPGATTIGWKKLAGLGPVSFSAPSSSSTEASFTVAGDYQLRLTADDGEVRTFRDLHLTVAATAPPLEIWRQTKFMADPGNPLVTGTLPTLILTVCPILSNTPSGLIPSPGMLTRCPSPSAWWKARAIFVWLLP